MPSKYVCVYIYIYVYTHTHTYVYVFWSIWILFPHHCKQLSLLSLLLLNQSPHGKKRDVKLTEEVGFSVFWFFVKIRYLTVSCAATWFLHQKIMFCFSVALMLRWALQQWGPQCTCDTRLSLHTLTSIQSCHPLPLSHFPDIQQMSCGGHPHLQPFVLNDFSLPWGCMSVSFLSTVLDYTLFRALFINALRKVSSTLLKTPETASILSVYLWSRLNLLFSCVAN